MHLTQRLRATALLLALWALPASLAAQSDPLATVRARWADVAGQIERNDAVVHRAAFNAADRSWPAVGVYRGQLSAWFGYLEEERTVTPHPLKVVDEKWVSAREYRAEYLYDDDGGLIFAMVQDPEKGDLRIYWAGGAPFRVQVGEAVQDGVSAEHSALATAVAARGAALAQQARSLVSMEDSWSDFYEHDWGSQP